MSLISVQNLTFAYDGSYDNIFENVSFQIDTDWKLGFTGRNGRGKTTFLNLLLNKYEYSGSISASVEFEYFPFAVSDVTKIAQEVVNEVNSDYMQWQLLREMNALQLDEDILYRPYNTLSNGEQTKLLLAALFLRENSFLLIDEPTNHLDMQGREVVARYLNDKKGFILVSHDRVFLDNCVDHILAINRTDIEVQRGTFSTWWENKERRDNYELTENEKLKGEIQRLKASSKEKASWSDKVEKTKNVKVSGLRPDKGYIGHKAAKMAKTSKAIEKRQTEAVEAKSKLLRNLEESESLKLTQLKFHTDRLLNLIDVSVAYGDNIVFTNLDLTIVQGDRIALTGKNGSGKSSLIKLIVGEDVPHSGRVERNGQLRISYVSQDSSHLSGNLSDYAMENGIDESLFKAILRKLDFSRVQFEKDISDFSAGQKKKVLLARSLCERAHLLVWDEPLNYIDVISRMQIESLMLDFQPTILFVEHDRFFCDKIATRTICL